jgi:hypothetical protein
MTKEVLQQHEALREQRRADGDLERREEPLWPGKRAVAAEQIATADTQRFAEIDRLRAVLSGLKRSGSPLPPALATQFSQLLGADLSTVRIHTSGPAASAAAAMGAQAFTYGAHIAFAPGAFDPSSPRSRHIIAHELVHVVQNQRAGGRAMELAARLDVGPSGSSVESEAESGARALARGQPFAVSSHSSLPGISLFRDGEPLDGGVSPDAHDAGVPGGSVPPPPSSAPSTSATSPAAGAAPTGTTPAVPPAAPSPRDAGVQPPPSSAARTPTARPSDVLDGGTPAPSATAGAADAGAPGGAPSAGIPDAAPSPGLAASPTGTVELDARVREVLEQRANPSARSQYAQGVSSVNVLRLQSLQYSFTKSGFGNTLFQAFVWPSEALGDHAGQIYSNNAYRGNAPAGLNVDTLQATIEGLRGVLHILGDISSLISGWAGIVAAVSGLLALITSETVIGGLTFGAIAAAADAVATITGLIRILCDLIDMLLGVLQMIILIVRARTASDPAARARYAQLLHKEANDFASTVTGVVLQVAVMAATAGAGAAMSRTAERGLLRTWANEFNKLINPRLVFKGGVRGVLGKFAIEEAGKGVATNGRRVLAVEAEEGFVKINRMRRGPGGRVTREREIVPFTTRNQMRGARLVTDAAAVRRIAVTATVGGVISTATGQINVALRAPSGPTTPTGSRGLDVPTRAGGALSTVEMWPSQIELFQTAKAPLPAARTRMQEQHAAAREQAGPEQAAAIDARLREALARTTRTQRAASQVQGDAAQGQQNTDRGAATAAQGREQRARADHVNTQIQAQGQRMSGAADHMRPPPPRDGFLGSIYNATIGRIGQALGSAQTWLRNMVGRLAMWAAGFSRQELDMAGIENDMRTSSTMDRDTQQQASGTQQQVSPLQQQVHELQRDRTTDQQQAIQAMADTLAFIQALDEAERSLNTAIDNGTVYLEAVAPVIRHELDTQINERPIDAAYIAPITSYADYIASSLDNTTGATAQRQAGEQFAAMRETFPMLDTSSGEAAVAARVREYNTAYASLADQARSIAARTRETMAAYVGTTDYAGVNENAAALDQFAAEFDRRVDELTDRLYAAVNTVLTSYTEQLDAAVASAGPAPADDAATPTASAPPDASAPPAASPPPPAAPPSSTEPTAGADPAGGMP